MKPRIDGTDAAVDAPSRSRVPPMIVRFVVAHDPEQRADLHDAVVADPVGQQPERRGEDQLGRIEERGHHRERRLGHRLTAVVGMEAGEVEEQQPARQPGAEAEGERPEEHGVERSHDDRVAGISGLATAPGSSVGVELLEHPGQNRRPVHSFYNRGHV